MSSNHSEHTSSNQHKPIEGSLPPRSTKHSREHESEEEGFEKTRRFPMIQMILFAFIALIAAFLVFYFWQQYDVPSSTKPYVDPLESSNQQENQQDQGDFSEIPEKDVSLEEDGDINNKEQDQGKEDISDNNQVDKEPADKQPTDKQDSVVEEPKQGPAVRTIHTIQPGETMYSITMKYFGTSDYIEYLAEFNQINDIREIKSGMELKIPEKP